MGRSREWIDWQEPFLPAAAHWLVERGVTLAQRADERGACALDEVICVMPGKRAGRVLIEALLRECESRGLHVRPPRTITPGVLTEVICSELAEPRATATQDESMMTWIAALRSAVLETIRPLVPKPPAPDDLLAWHALAATIRRLHDDLAGGMRSFSEVAERAARLELFGETDRWHALDALHQSYLEALEKIGLTDPHEARVGALHKAQGLPPLGLDIILLGVPELNALQRRALEHAENITALVHAPPELANAFDDFGCVMPEHWAQRTINLDEGRIITADRPDDQAQAGLDQIARWNGAPIDSITIGLGDEALGEPLERAAEWAGLSVHRAEARAITETAPCKLLESLAAWIEDRRFAHFAALLRHADIEQWLTEESGTPRAEVAIRDWISLLDEYFTDHLHTRLTGDWLGERAPSLKRIHDAVTALASSLLSQPIARPLGEWSKPILEILQRIYIDDRDTQNSESPRWHATQNSEICIAIRDRLAQIASIEPALQPECDAATAISLLLTSLEGESLATPSREDQIEALGWLELHLDAAPQLVVLGINDGSVPQAFIADPFLPDSLRAALGLPCNATRYARDAYLLEAIARSRERLVLIAGRRGPEGDPLTPSRLLFACDPDGLPERVLMLSDEKRAVRHAIPMGASDAAPASEFTIFTPPPGPCAIDEMHVTSFRLYLQCPFRWWLRMREGLCAVDDGAAELDPLGFGGLAHDVLEGFALDEEIRDSTDAGSIAQWLSRRLGCIATERYGSHPPPAVRVQLDRLRRRFEAFALFQARTRADGWRIVEGEVKVRGVPLEIPGQEPIRITGKIDRIDEWRDGSVKRYRIIDYKTSEQPETPFQTHHDRKTCDPEKWIDLQLPLYRLLVAHLGYGSSFQSVETGYIILPRDVSGIDFLPAKWNESDHDAAIECAREVVRKIRAGDFPMSDDVDSRYDDFVNICQTNVRGRAALVAANAEESES